MIFAVFDVLLTNVTVNICINCTFLHLLCVITTDDHSRVALDVADGTLESDYINASYIDV